MRAITDRDVDTDSDADTDTARAVENSVRYTDTNSAGREKAKRKRTKLE